MERGYERMTVDEVAERAGVGKATVYRRYPSKEDLAHDALQRIFEIEVPVPATGSLRGDLIEMYRSTLEFANSPIGEQFLRLVAGEASRDEWVAQLYREMYEVRRRMARDLLQRAVDAGEVRPDLDSDEIMDALPGMLVVRAICRLPMPRPEDAERMVDLLLTGAVPR
jgi:AcrR family transcriptional regulator